LQFFRGEAIEAPRWVFDHCPGFCANSATGVGRRPPIDAATRELAHDIFKQLIEINSTDSVGSTTLAAQAMAKRLLGAGFPKADVVVLGPNERKGNMVARLRIHRAAARF
jgi:hypothetical protein